MTIVKNTVTPINSVKDIRHSVVDCSEYTISLCKKEHSIQLKEAWDVANNELNEMLKQRIEYISDYHIQCWLNMIKEFGYYFYYQHELIAGKFIVNYYAFEYPYYQ